MQGRTIPAEARITDVRLIEAADEQGHRRTGLEVQLNVSRSSRVIAANATGAVLGTVPVSPGEDSVQLVLRGPVTETVYVRVRNETLGYYFQGPNATVQVRLSQTQIEQFRGPHHHGWSIPISDADAQPLTPTQRPTVTTTRSTGRSPTPTAGANGTVSLGLVVLATAIGFGLEAFRHR